MRRAERVASTLRPSAAFGGPGSSSARQISCSSSSSIVVVELEAVAVEDLEAVVVGWVVRRRDHDPRGERPVAGEIGQGRRRHDADDVDVDAEAGRAGRDGGDEHVTRAAGVLADDDRAARTDEPMRGRAAEARTRRSA